MIRERGRRKNLALQIAALLIARPTSALGRAVRLLNRTLGLRWRPYNGRTHRSPHGLPWPVVLAHNGGCHRSGLCFDGPRLPVRNLRRRQAWRTRDSAKSEENGRSSANPAFSWFSSSLEHRVDDGNRIDHGQQSDSDREPPHRPRVIQHLTVTLQTDGVAKPHPSNASLCHAEIG